VFHLRQSLHPLFDLDMARRARANASAVMLQIDIVRKCNVQEALAEESFAGHVHRKKRYGRQLSRNIFKEPFIDPSPVQAVDKIIDIGRALRTVLVVVGVFEHVARDEWHGTPDGAIVVLVNQHVLELPGTQSIEYQQSPSGQLGRKCSGFEIGLPFFERSKIALDLLMNFNAERRIAITAETFPIDIVKDRAGMIPCPAALELPKRGIIPIRFRGIGIEERFLDLVQLIDVAFMVGIVMPVGRFGIDHFGQYGLRLFVGIGAFLQFEFGCFHVSKRIGECQRSDRCDRDTIKYYTCSTVLPSSASATLAFRISCASGSVARSKSFCCSTIAAASSLLTTRRNAY